MSKKFYILTGAILFLIGVGVGFLFPRSIAHISAQASREGGYAFVNPLLTCDISEDQPSEDFSKLKMDLQSEIEKLTRSGDVARISVYFRDMNSGRWTGINYDDLYIPASLMKVPLLISYLKASQESPALLSRQYTISALVDNSEVQYFKPQHPLSPGSYSVEVLLDAMIKGSDNNAQNVLYNKIATSSFIDVHNTLDIPVGDENAEIMSPKNFMVLFRVLYNATYISRLKSQQALEFMSRSEFKEGIVAGVDGHTVSHKFGERSIYMQDQHENKTLKKRELHDCGIVYYPANPYGLCVMTEGADFDKLKAAIASMSNLVYKSIDAGSL